MLAWGSDLFFLDAVNIEMFYVDVYWLKRVCEPWARSPQPTVVVGTAVQVQGNVGVASEP